MKEIIHIYAIFKIANELFSYITLISSISGTKLPVNKTLWGWFERGAEVVFVLTFSTV